MEKSDWLLFNDDDKLEILSSLLKELNEATSREVIREKEKQILNIIDWVQDYDEIWV